MLVLHGFDVSNYYNMIKLALAIKNVSYQPALVYPNQSAEFLALSPMGKVPALQTPDGTLCETSVILEYLDETYPEPPLYPNNSFARAKVKELIKICELYIELPARRCFPEAFFAQQISDETKKDALKALQKGIRALAKTAKFSPYLAGSTLSAADIVFLYSVDLAALVAEKIFAYDLLSEAPGASDLLVLLKQNKQVEKINEDRKVADIAFKHYIANLT